ncbi:AGE family epimerase/isomerase [Hyphomonas johnsonii]|uniref:Mannose-6-phosphate isomerase n=1 Tax=Hyphomonas johnsonii MHS-2 TaxID=1280950 RepID=A0A059FV74_9PROT|nr:AGE family epimerase/isomerase [Hyphomonas johnsonii]KCZ94549.1 mannose-6-phosphate isomerase [Hyphomonas johnsonii MHS-2]
MHRAIPFDEIHRWMFDTALPLWADVGFDGQTGTFAEKLAFSGKPIDTGFHRTRVTGRQTYVFAHAALMGWERGQDLAAAGARKLNAIYQGPEHGWPRTTNTAGDVIDGTPDLYDLAFTLFGFAWHYRASQDPESLASAHRALDFIELHMRAPVGFWHELPPSGWRLQNPHMHLLEASLVAFEASGDERFLKTAKQIVTLFRAHLFDGRTLAEYFDADWNRAPGDEGQLAEPGHQLEWAWILIQYGRLAGEDTLALAEALVGFAEAHGFDDRTGRVLQVVRSDGTIVDGGSRTWPNTERIKGHLALFEATGRDPRQAVATSARVLLDTYLATEVPGLWIDRFNADGLPEASDAPASTLYHVFLAFAEILRLRDAIEAIAD